MHNIGIEKLVRTDGRIGDPRSIPLFSQVNHIDKLTTCDVTIKHCNKIPQLASQSRTVWSEREIEFADPEASAGKGGGVDLLPLLHLLW